MAPLVVEEADVLLHDDDARLFGGLVNGSLKGFPKWRRAYHALRLELWQYYLLFTAGQFVRKRCSTGHLVMCGLG